MGKNNKQFAVIGLGVFGSTVAKTLAELGFEVLAVDRDITCVDRIAPYVTKALQVDATNLEELKALGISEFDAVVVAIGNHFEESMLTTMNVKALGVKYIVAKAKNKQCMQILQKIGADKIVRAEKDMGQKIAKTLVRNNIIDMVEIDADYSIIEMKAPIQWVGHSIKNLNVRSAFKMNILGIRYANHQKLHLTVDPDYIINSGDHFLVIGQTKAVEKYDYLS
ncbi:MAG: potassium channel family protein [Beduini sp.]